MTSLKRLASLQQSRSSALRTPAATNSQFALGSQARVTAAHPVAPVAVEPSQLLQPPSATDQVREGIAVAAAAAGDGAGALGNGGYAHDATEPFKCKAGPAAVAAASLQSPSPLGQSPPTAFDLRAWMEVDSVSYSGR